MVQVIEVKEPTVKLDKKTKIKDSVGHVQNMVITFDNRGSVPGMNIGKNIWHTGKTFKPEGTVSDMVFDLEGTKMLNPNISVSIIVPANEDLDPKKHTMVQFTAPTSSTTIDEYRMAYRVLVP